VTAVAAVHDGPVVASSGGLDVVDCAVCGFRHVVPLPTAEELDRLYREEYFSTEIPFYLDRYAEDADWWRLTYAHRFELLEELLPAGRRRLIDVGSGPGLFLEVGLARGWDAVGVEPSRQAAEHSRSRGCTVVESFFGSPETSDLGPVDLVHSSLVLEHVADPAGILAAAYDALAPGGLLCVVVPNDFNPLQRALHEADGYEQWWVTPHHHLNYFDGPSLEALFARCGFEPLAREATFPMELFLLMGERYVGDDAVGRACHSRRKRMEHVLAAGAPEARRDLYRALGSAGLGREVVVVGRRT
jgi:SAM-dependent methyltransferase